LALGLSYSRFQLREPEANQHFRSWAPTGPVVDMRSQPPLTQTGSQVAGYPRPCARDHTGAEEGTSILWQRFVGDVVGVLPTEEQLKLLLCVSRQQRS